MAKTSKFIDTSLALDSAGLVWHPEIGDEIALREDYQTVSILVDPQGMTPGQLRNSFLWLPTVEQLVSQFEARQALLQHVGVNDVFKYEVVLETAAGLIQVQARTIRQACGAALENLLQGTSHGEVH